MRFTNWVLTFGVFMLTACAGTPVKLDSDSVKPTERLVFGRLVDLNPEGKELGVSYVLSKEAQNGFLSLENKLPQRERSSGYFWATVPANAKYFGVRSLNFEVKSQSGEASLRDEKTHLPLFGVELADGKGPFYVGDITIRSGMTAGDKDFLGVQSDAFELKEFSVRDERVEARKFLLARGIDISEMKGKIFDVKNEELLSQGKKIPKKFRK